MDKCPESAAIKRSLVVFMSAFCAVTGAETGLELFIEVIVGEVGLNL